MTEDQPIPISPPLDNTSEASESVSDGVVQSGISSPPIPTSSSASSSTVSARIAPAVDTLQTKNSKLPFFFAATLGIFLAINGLLIHQYFQNKQHSPALTKNVVTVPTSNPIVNPTQSDPTLSKLKNVSEDYSWSTIKQEIEATDVSFLE